MHWSMLGFSEGALMLRPEPVGVAVGMRNVRVVAVKRAEARIQVLVRYVGIVMILQWVESRPVFLTIASCYSRWHVVGVVFRVLPVQEVISICMFINLTRKWRTPLVCRELGVSRMGREIMSRYVIRLRLFGWWSCISLFFCRRNLGFLSQFISQGEIGLVCPLRVKELTFDAISALFI